MANVATVTFNYILVKVPIFIECRSLSLFCFLFTGCILHVSIIQLLVPVTGYILPVCILQVLLLVSDCKLGLPIENVLQFWEIQTSTRGYIFSKGESNTRKYVFPWGELVPTSPWGRLHPVPTAVLIVTMIPTRTHSVLKTQFLWVIGFLSFILITLFWVFLILVYHYRIWYFPVMGGVKRMGVGVGGCMFLKNGYDIKKGGWKKKGDWYNVTLNFGNSVLGNSDWDKISHSLT